MRFETAGVGGIRPSLDNTRRLFQSQSDGATERIRILPGAARLAELSFHPKRSL
jgi:hypothetical protein